MDPIDQLLAQMQAQYGDAATSAAPPPASVIPHATAKAATAKIGADDPIDSLLSEVKAGYEAQDAAEQLARQEQLEIEQRRQAQLQQQRRAAIAQQAQTWLAALDPLSTEGLWFEQFAHKYPSKLEAAIEYLLVSETPSSAANSPDT